MLTFQGVSRLVSKAIGFIYTKKSPPVNPAHIQALRHSQEQNASTIEKMRTDFEQTTLSSNDYSFKLDRVRSLFAAQLEIVSDLHSLGAATKQDIAECQAGITNFESGLLHRSLQEQAQTSQSLYSAMEKRLQNQSADNPAESIEHLFTLNQMLSLQSVRLELLQTSKASENALAECKNYISAIEQQKAIVYGKIKQQLEGEPKAIAAIERELTGRNITDNRLLYLIREMRARTFDHFRQAETLAANEMCSSGRVTSEMKAAIDAATPLRAMEQRLSAAQQHQLSIVRVSPREAAVPLLEAA